MATYKRSKSLQMEDMKKRSKKRVMKKSGGMCKLATKGKGKAYGKNS